MVAHACYLASRGRKTKVQGQPWLHKKFHGKPGLPNLKINRDWNVARWYSAWLACV